MLAFCDWQPTETAEQWRCSTCGKQRSWKGPDSPPLRNCGNNNTYEPQPIREPPPNWQKAINFTKAIFNQAPLVGIALLTLDESKAFRNEAEIAAIANICKACPLFNGQVCTHQNCGCAIDEERSAWWSKIAWRSQQCPDNPPRWK